METEFNSPEEKKVYDDFFEYWTKTYQKSPEFLALGGQMQTITFTLVLSKWLDEHGIVFEGGEV